MSCLKRAFDELDDSDEEQQMGKQILPVARLPMDFDGMPTNGMEYLFTVRRDARRLPNYTRAANPFESRDKEAEKPEPCITNRIDIPSEEWRTIFKRRFKNFRTNATQSVIGVQLPLEASSSIALPQKKERDSWWAFINGRPETEWNALKRQKLVKKELSSKMRAWDENYMSQFEVQYTKELPNETYVVDEYGEVTTSLPTPSTTPHSEDAVSDLSQKHKEGPRQPTPTLLTAMDNRYCIHLLMYFEHWISQHLAQLESNQPLPYPLSKSSQTYPRLNQTHARWIFALLSRVDEQLASDEMNTLRTLARACLSLIKDLNKDSVSPGQTSNETPVVSKPATWVGDPSEAPIDEKACWIVVAIVSDFWGQKDIWMDAEAMLNTPS